MGYRSTIVFGLGIILLLRVVSFWNPNDFTLEKAYAHSGVPLSAFTLNPPSIDVNEVGEPL